MFEGLTPPDPDPILGVATAYKADPRPDTINLSVGMYQNDNGNVPVMRSVKKAGERVIANRDSLSYISAPGVPIFIRSFPHLVIGESGVNVEPERVGVVQSIAGTGALYLLMELAKRENENTTLWLPNPTWANHHGLAKTVGLPVKEYPYYDRERHLVDFDAMVDSLKSAGKDDLVLLHGCCHNPAGGDPTPEQWEQLAKLSKEQGFTVLIDIAYQGLGDGLEQDAVGVRKMLEHVDELLIAQSASKNFAVYRERLGAAIVITKEPKDAKAASEILGRIARATYSMTPSFAAESVGLILEDEELRADWEKELDEMCERLTSMREKLASNLKKLTNSNRFDFILKEKGMFSFLGLNKSQLDQLREDYGIYALGSSRINVGGLSSSNVEKVAQHIAAVL